MATIRRIIFYLFVLAYAIVCPLTILYAFGLIYRPGEEGGVIRTGLISISTIPPGSDIYLGRLRYTRKSPAVIRDLLPDEYSIRLSRKGYRTWSHRVVVKPGRAAVVENVLFLPNDIPLNRIADTSFEDIVPVPNSPVFLVQRSLRAEDLYVVDTTQDASRPLRELFPAGGRLGKSLVQDVHVSPAHGGVLFKVGPKEGARSVWARPGREANGESSSVWEDVTDIFMEPAGEIAWAGDHPEQMFVIGPGGIEILDVREKSRLTLWEGALLGHGSYKGRLLFLADDHRLYAADAGGGEPKLMSASLLPHEDYLKSARAVEIIPYSDELFLFKDERGRLFANQGSQLLVREGVEGLLRHPNVKVFAVWGGDRLGILEPVPDGRDADGDGDEPLDVRKLQVRWVETHARAIEQVFWAYDGKYLIYRDGGSVFLLELWNTDFPRREVVAHARGGKKVVWMERARRLYFLDRWDAGLVWMSLAPGES
ncbi:MAG: PEGA domain-containing protein [Candidatus Omnitrophica bacterium]|nr:PEGA domain-containing protein [Candidatus Omnitrophota bacterium]